LGSLVSEILQAQFCEIPAAALAFGFSIYEFRLCLEQISPATGIAGMTLMGLLQIVSQHVFPALVTYSRYLRSEFGNQIFKPTPSAFYQ
jgi:hypothetical protein